MEKYSSQASITESSTDCEQESQVRQQCRTKATNFTKDIEKSLWIEDHFRAKTGPEFITKEEENSVELNCDKTLTTKFSCVELWISIIDDKSSENINSICDVIFL